MRILFVWRRRGGFARPSRGCTGGDGERSGGISRTYFLPVQEFFELLVEGVRRTHPKAILQVHQRVPRLCFGDQLTTVLAIDLVEAVEPSGRRGRPSADQQV